MSANRQDPRVAPKSQDPPAPFRSTIHQKPFPGFVPDEETAIEVATAILKPLFGKEYIGLHRFRAKLTRGIWVVKGQVDWEKVKEPAIIHPPTVQIRKKDGTIFGVQIY